MKKKLLLLVLISTVIFNVNANVSFAAEEEIPKPTGIEKE